MDFRTARDFLLSHRQDYETAYRDFEWPRAEHFNWALDWFDAIAKGNHRPGLWIVDDDGSETILTFAELAARSDALASWLRHHGVRRGDRTLLMLGNRAALWESILALTKLGSVMIPSTTLLTASDIQDRVTRGHVAHVIAESAQAELFAGVAGGYTRIAVGDPVAAWLSYDDHSTVNPRACARAPRRVQAGTQAGIRRVAEDHLRKDQACRPSHQGARATRERRRRSS